MDYVLPILCMDWGHITKGVFALVDEICTTTSICPQQPNPIEVTWASGQVTLHWAWVGDGQFSTAYLKTSHPPSLEMIWVHNARLLHFFPTPETSGNFHRSFRPEEIPFFHLNLKKWKKWKNLQKKKCIFQLQKLLDNCGCNNKCICISQVHLFQMSNDNNFNYIRMVFFIYSLYICRALGRHFLLRVRAPTIWISKGHKQNLKGPSIEIHY